ncbi:MAG: alpha/beta hydrolase family protein [Gemmatimonadota bacterium]
MIRRSLFFSALAVISLGGLATAQAPFVERDVMFESGTARLAGTLIVPEADGPVPAIVFLHGSGPMTRAGFRSYAEEYAGMGVASLAYDKRGAGESVGESGSPFDDYSDDAAAAIEFLRSQPEIDSDRVGFWGISQAGWIGPMAAVKTPGVAFMIMVSGGGASPKASELFSWAREFEGAGLDEAQSEVAMGVIRDYYEYLATGEGRPRLVARIDSIRAGTIRGLHMLPREALGEFADALTRILPTEARWSDYSALATYDPATDIATLNIPLLLLFGDRDTDHPTDQAIDGWREGLDRAGNDGATIVVFPGAGHGIRMADGWRGEGRAPFADGYRDVMAGWLWRHVVAVDAAEKGAN